MTLLYFISPRPRPQSKHYIYDIIIYCHIIHAPDVCNNDDYSFMHNELGT